MGIVSKDSVNGHVQYYYIIYNGVLVMFFCRKDKAMELHVPL